MSHIDLRDHPRQTFLFFVAQDIDEIIRSSVRDFVLELAARRKWLLGPPKFVNSRDDSGDVSRGDLPVETVGAYIQLYSANSLPKDIDLAQYLDVADLVEALKEFSHLNNLAIEIELNGELIGAVEDGVVDRSLNVGLLAPWKQRVQ